jgi:hypothetical protein
MNLKTRPLLIAAGVGGAIQIVIQLVSSGFSLLVASSMDYSESTENILVATSLAATALACFCPLLVDVGVGLLYSWLHARTAPIKVEDGLGGGVSAGALARLVSGLLAICLSFFLAPLIASQMLEAGMPPEMMSSMMGVSVIGGLIGLVIGIVAGALLGVVGGGVGALIFGPKQSPVQEL